MDIPVSAWAEAEIPPHLRMRVAVIGPDGKELAASRDLESLKKKKWRLACHLPLIAGAELGKNGRGKG